MIVPISDQGRPVGALAVRSRQPQHFGADERAALEAMACEVPVISSNTGGIPELNVQGVTGFMSPVGDVEDMTQKALFVLDKANLPGFKANALKRAQEFDITRILPLYEDYYQRIMEKTASKATI